MKLMTGSLVLLVAAAMLAVTRFESSPAKAPAWPAGVPQNATWDAVFCAYWR